VACDAQTLITAAAAQKFFALSDRDLKQAILYGLCAAPGAGTTAQTLISGAYAQGYDKLSDRDLLECILVIVCAGP
jgi:hypothetical protein